jgi:hypothetical protein
MYESGNLTAFPESGNLESFPEAGVLQSFTESGNLTAFPESGGLFGIDPGFFGYQYEEDPELVDIDPPPPTGDVLGDHGVTWTGADVASIVDSALGLTGDIIDAATGKPAKHKWVPPPAVTEKRPRSPFESPWIWVGGAAILAVLLMRKG